LGYKRWKKIVIPESEKTDNVILAKSFSSEIAQANDRLKALYNCAHERIPMHHYMIIGTDKNKRYKLERNQVVEFHSEQCEEELEESNGCTIGTLIDFVNEEGAIGYCGNKGVTCQSTTQGACTVLGVKNNLVRDDFRTVVRTFNRVKDCCDECEIDKKRKKMKKEEELLN